MSERENIVRLVKTAVKALEEKKASDITVIDISGVSTVADFFIIASAENIRQTAALCDNTEEALYKAGFPCRQVEGKAAANWILMDYNDVIIHIFDKENRAFYDIERVWRDGKTVTDIEALS